EAGGFDLEQCGPLCSTCGAMSRAKSTELLSSLLKRTLGLCRNPVKKNYRGAQTPCASVTFGCHFSTILTDSHQPEGCLATLKGVAYMFLKYYFNDFSPWRIAGRRAVPLAAQTRAKRDSEFP